MRVFLGFFIVFFVTDVTKSENDNECLERKVQDFSSTSGMQKFESLMDTISILMEERHVCKCLQDRVRELENEVFRLQRRNQPVKDCRSLYGDGERKDGIYAISPDEITSFPVYCDMTNGGWTVIQRRIDGEVNFDRVWVDYARGFGNLSADFWLGLRYIHLLASDLNEISFELTIAESGRNASAVYKNFTVDDEADFFRMHVSREAVYNNEMSLYIDNNNGFYYHNNGFFTTRDSDHDSRNDINCAENNGGYWYRGCVTIGNLNDDFDEMLVWSGKSTKISKTEIKIRRLDFS